MSERYFQRQIDRIDKRLERLTRSVSGSAGTSTVGALTSTALTVAAIATDLTLTVTSIVGFSDGDPVSVQLDTGAIHTTTVDGAPAGFVITIDDAMPSGAAIGNLVSLDITEIVLGRGNYNTLDDRFDGIDELPGAMRLGVTITAGVTATAALRTTPDSAVRDIGEWVIVDAYTTQAELCTIDAAGAADPVAGATFAYSHAIDDLVLPVRDRVLHARFFGAIGDGIIDDTDALNAVLTAVTTVGGTVSVPDMKITSEIILPDFADGLSLLLKGDKPWTLITFTPTTGSLFKSALTGEYKRTKYTFEDLSLYSTTSVDANAIYIAPKPGEEVLLGPELRIRNVKINGFTGGYGIYAEYTIGAVLENVYVRSCHTGIYWADTSNACNFYHVTCMFNTDFGAKITNCTGFGWFGGWIEGNHKCGLYISGLYSASFRQFYFELNNFFEAANTYAIELEAVDGHANGDIVFSDLYFNDDTIHGKIHMVGVAGYANINVHFENVRYLADDGIKLFIDGLYNHGIFIFGGTIRPAEITNTSNYQVFMHRWDSALNRLDFPHFLGGKRWSYGTGAPVAGTWAVGDFIWNTAPVDNGVLCWQCIGAGTPGIWAGAPSSAYPEFASIVLADLTSGYLPYKAAGVTVLSNGNMESWASATDLNTWTESLQGASTLNREDADIHGGTYSARFDVDADNGRVRIYKNVTLIPHMPYILSVWYKTAVSRTISISLKDSSYTAYLDSAGHWVEESTDIVLPAVTDWTEYTLEFYGHPEYTLWLFYVQSVVGTSTSLYVDDITITPGDILEDSPISTDGTNVDMSGALGLAEMAAPAGAANVARIYAVDNGAGKTRLMVIFGSGAAQELAIEA